MRTISEKRMNGHRQQGISMVMSLIMLVVLTMIAISATYSTNSSMRIVGNMQMKDEAQIAAQYAIDSVLSNLNNFTTPVAQTLSVDMDNNGTADYSVTTSPPVCLFSSSEGLPANETGVSGAEMTYWEFTAQVTHVPSGSKSKITFGLNTALLPYMATAGGC